MSQKPSSVEDEALVRRNHVLDVDEGVFATVDLHHFQGLLNQVAQNEALALAVVNLVANVDSALLKEVHNWQQLSEIWHKGLTHSLIAANQSLDNLQSDSHNFLVPSVQSSYTRLLASALLLDLPFNGMINCGTTGKTFAPPR